MGKGKKKKWKKAKKKIPNRIKLRPVIYYQFPYAKSVCEITEESIQLLHPKTDFTTVAHLKESEFREKLRKTCINICESKLRAEGPIRTPYRALVTLLKNCRARGRDFFKYLSSQDTKYEVAGIFTQRRFLRNFLANEGKIEFKISLFYLPNVEMEDEESREEDDEKVEPLVNKLICFISSGNDQDVVNYSWKSEQRGYGLTFENAMKGVEDPKTLQEFENELSQHRLMRLDFNDDFFDDASPPVFFSSQVDVLLLKKNNLLESVELKSTTVVEKQRKGRAGGRLVTNKIKTQVYLAEIKRGRVLWGFVREDTREKNHNGKRATVRLKLEEHVFPNKETIEVYNIKLRSLFRGLQNWIGRQKARLIEDDAVGCISARGLCVAGAVKKISNEDETEELKQMYTLVLNSIFK